MTTDRARLKAIKEHAMHHDALWLVERLEKLVNAVDSLMEWDNNVLTDDNCCEEYKQSVRDVMDIAVPLSRFEEQK